MSLWGTSVTTPTAARILVEASLSFRFRCVADSPVPVCQPAITLSVDGTPLVGGELTLEGVLEGTETTKEVALAGVSAAVVPAGAHTIAVYANTYIDNGTSMAFVSANGANFVVLPVGAPS